MLVKIAGLLATITVGANAFSYSRYRRQNLAKIRSPINESAEVLADFNSHSKAFSSSRTGIFVIPCFNRCLNKLFTVECVLASDLCG